MRAALQAVDFGGHVGHARQHYHGLIRAGAQHLVQDVPAIHVRHHQVKDDQVVVGFERLLERLRSIRREAGQVSRRRQGAANERADAGLIVHDEDSLSGCARWRCRHGRCRSLMRNHVGRLALSQRPRFTRPPGSRGPGDQCPRRARNRTGQMTLLQGCSNHFEKQVKSDVTRSEIVTRLSHKRLQLFSWPAGRLRCALGSSRSASGTRNRSGISLPLVSRSGAH